MNNMDKITTEMAEHFCDELCRHPFRTDITQEQLDEICDGCEMGKYICCILNEHSAVAEKGK